jgi:hypothetical protein
MMLFSDHEHRVVHQSSEVGTAYFLVHPNFGSDLKKLADDTNKKLPHIWWSNLEGDCEAVKSISGSFGSDQRMERILIRKLVTY